MYRAIRPVPKNPTRVGRGRSRLSRSAAEAAEAAVLLALMIELSRHANGYPVTGSLRISTAEARGTPDPMFAGKLEIHFSPSTRESPSDTRPDSLPREAGRAIIRASGRSGKRRNEEGGFTVLPAPCSR